MIHFLKGKIIHQAEKFIVLDVNGIGFKIFLSKKNLAQTPSLEEEYKIFCHLNIQETGIDIYGFPTQQELEFFNFLNDLKGIGPKGAIEVASIGTREKIEKAIKENNQEIIKEIFKIGQKRAQAVIIALSQPKK